MNMNYFKFCLQLGIAVLCLVVQSFLTLLNPWTAAWQAPLPIGTLQARILKWVAMPSFRGSTQPRDQTEVSQIAGRFFTFWATREAQDYCSG